MKKPSNTSPTQMKINVDFVNVHWGEDINLMIMIQSPMVAAAREEDQTTAAEKSKDVSNEEEEDLVIVTIHDGPIFYSSEEYELMADGHILKDLEQHPSKTGMPRSSAFTLNNTNIPSSTVEAKPTVFVLKLLVLDSKVHIVYEQIVVMVSKTEKVLADHDLRPVEQNDPTTYTLIWMNCQSATLLRLLLINFSNLEGVGDVYTAEGVKSKKDDDVDSSTKSL